MQKMAITDYCALRICSPTSEASGEGSLQSMKESVEKWLPILGEANGAAAESTCPPICLLPARNALHYWRLQL
jgi:hypothetical protein